MKILFRIEGISSLYKLMKKQKKLDFIFQGNTLQDLVNGLASKFGPTVKHILLDKNEEIDMLPNLFRSPLKGHLNMESKLTAKFLWQHINR